jgi:dTDP-4-amino-4,6-dideoxygalactose transaminase
MVFDVAVGAGWLPFPPEEDKLPNTLRLHGKELVLLGESKVERWYKDSFLALLDYWIQYHTDDPDTHEELWHNLPSIPKEKRQALVEEFLAKQKAAGQPVKRVEMADWAGVDYSDLRKWVRGTLPDTSDKSKHILMLLLHNVRSEPKRQYFRADTR